MTAPATPDLPRAVLFACNLNTVRSPMASAITRHLTGHRVYAKSAGVRAGEPDTFAIAIMDEIGIDISGHEPVSLSELHDSSFDLIITLAPEAHHHALEFTRAMAVEVEYWPTQDPTLATGSRDQILAAYRACRDELFARIKQRFGVGGGPTM